MSYTAIGKNKVYASIEDLPENQALTNGDRLLVQTEEGTVLVDYENIKIDTAHTNFGDKIQAVIDFTANVEDYLNQFQSTLEELKYDIKSLSTRVATLENTSGSSTTLSPQTETTITYSYDDNDNITGVTTTTKGK